MGDRSIVRFSHSRQPITGKQLNMALKKSLCLMEQRSNV